MQGDTGSSPGQQRFHMLRSNETLKPVGPRVSALEQKKPPQWEAEKPSYHNQRKPQCSNKGQAQRKNKTNPLLIVI